MTSDGAAALVVLGVLLQVAWMLYPWTNTKATGLLIALGVAVVVFALSSRDQRGASLDHNALWSAGVFVAFVAFSYREQLMPWIQELALVLWAPVCIYALVVSWGLRDWRLELLLAVIAGVVIAIFVVRKLTPFARLLFYSAYLLQVVLVALLQFRFGDFSDISDGKVLDGDPVRFLFDGMGMTYLAVYGWYLYRVIPIPGRSQPWADRMKEWHEETETMERHFSVLRLNFWYALGVLFMVSSVLAINHWARWLDPWVMIGLVLTVVPNVLRFTPVLQFGQNRSIPT